MKELIITYHLDGRIEIEGQGFVGTECLEASKPFEKALGLTEIDRKMKPEAKGGGVYVNNRNRNKIQS